MGKPVPMGENFREPFVTTNLEEIVENERERRLRDAAAYLLQACERALAIEDSVTQGQEKSLRLGYRQMLEDAINRAKYPTTFK